MGNTANRPQPTESRVTDLELRLAPRKFYLVFGKPAIQYTGAHTHGPLIYDVEIEYDNDEAVERAATLDLTCAVPRRQKIELIGSSSPSLNVVGASQGLALAFQLAATHPPQRVRVYAGVSVEYHAGRGVQLRNSGSVAAGSLCILDTTETDGLITVVTNPLVLPQLLRPIKYEERVNAEGLSTKQWVTYAPLAIEVRIEEMEEPIKKPQHSAPCDRLALPPLLSSVSSPSLSSHAKLSKKLVVQYTFLEVPEEVTQLSGSVRSGEEAQTVRRLPCKVAKQLLQVGNEVYELEDVFADTHEACVQGPAAVEEEGGFCVVCLTSQKNTTILPCRHLCLCSDCASHLRLRNNRCPLCRGNIERIMTL